MITSAVPESSACVTKPGPSPLSPCLAEAHRRRCTA